MTAAGALTGSEVVPILQSGVNVRTTTQAIANLGGAGYLVYTALLTQTGTDAPVATVLENTLGGTVVWSYDSQGSYLATLAGAFPAGKVFIPTGITNTTNGEGFAADRVDDNSVSVTTGFSGLNNDVLNTTSFEIRVYP